MWERGGWGWGGCWCEWYYNVRCNVRSTILNRLCRICLLCMSYLFIPVIYMSRESEKHTGQVRFRPVVRPLVTTFVKLSILQRTVIVLLGVFGLLISSTSVLYFCTIQTRNLNVFTPFILVHSPVYPYVYRMNLTKKNFILVQYNVVTFHQSLIYIFTFPTT